MQTDTAQSPTASVQRMKLRQQGTSLVEASVVLAVIAIMASTSLPGLTSLHARHQLQGVAAQLETDLQLARSEAVARNESVRVNFATNPSGGSCYVLHTGDVGDCSCSGEGKTVCNPGAQALRSVPLAAGFPVQLTSNSRSILFDAVKGTATPTATIRVSSSAGQIRQIVNVMGRVRACSPDGGLAGYRPC